MAPWNHRGGTVPSLETSMVSARYTKASTSLDLWLSTVGSGSHPKVNKSSSVLDTLVGFFLCLDEPFDRIVSCHSTIGRYNRAFVIHAKNLSGLSFYLEVEVNVPRCAICQNLVQVRPFGQDLTDSRNSSEARSQPRSPARSALEGSHWSIRKPQEHASKSPSKYDNRKEDNVNSAITLQASNVLVSELHKDCCQWKRPEMPYLANV